MSTCLYIRYERVHLPKFRKFIWVMTTVWVFALASHRPFIQKMVDNLLDDQSVSQPAAIGQPTRHLKKCQPNPYSDLKGVSIFYINIQVTFCQMASQPAGIGQPTSHLTKCQPNPKSDPDGGSGWHFVRGPVSHLAAMGEPTSHLTKC